MKSKYQLSCEMTSKEKIEVQECVKKQMESLKKVIGFESFTFDSSQRNSYLAKKQLQETGNLLNNNQISVEIVGFFMNIFYHESIILVISIYSMAKQTPVTEELHVELEKSGFYQEENRFRATFTHFNQEELQSHELWLFCKIYRKGALKQSDHPTANSTHVSSNFLTLHSCKVKRPLGISMINLCEIWDKRQAKNSSSTSEKIEYLLKIFVPHHENDFDSLFSCVVDKKDGTLAF